MSLGAEPPAEPNAARSLLDQLGVSQIALEASHSPSPTPERP
jgi:hypothetical protein